MTVSVDVRTRVDSDAKAVDAHELFEHLLPERIAQNGHLASPGATELHPPPLTLDVEGDAWTLALDGDRITLTAGERTDAALAQLTAEQLSDLVNDVQTPMGFFTGGTLAMPRGGLGDFLDWWVVLRSLLDGRRAHTRGSVTFRDAAGEPLDLHRSFTLADRDEEMAHFLGEAGFLHIAGVFTEAEMAQVDADIDGAVASYTPDDGRSWWARTQDGEHRAVRLQHFHEHSPTTQDLLADDRFLRVGRLTSDGHRAGERHLGWNVIEALIKPIGVVEGISDVPWHKDCSLGRHSYRCCTMTVGISVTGADERSGQLRVVAGSHRALIQPAFVRKGLDLPQVDLPTAAGDVTVHLSCTMHMSQPPVDRERRVMYTGFDLPARGPRDKEQAEKLSRIREGAYKTVSQPPARTTGH
jgi:hypothetical protein